MIDALSSDDERGLQVGDRRAGGVTMIVNEFSLHGVQLGIIDDILIVVVWMMLFCEEIQKVTFPQLESWQVLSAQVVTVKHVRAIFFCQLITSGY